jgi:tight adherence protein B
MESLIYSFVFFVIFFLVFLVYLVKDAFDKKRRQRFLKTAFGATAPSRGNSPDPVTFSSGHGAKAPANQTISLTSLNYLLIAAGISLSPEKFITITIAGGGIASLAVFSLLSNWMAAVVVFGICMVLPVFFLYMKKRKIEQQLVSQMPDALGMIVRALRVGQSVDGSLKDVAAAIPPPISTEIRIIYEEIRMGIPFDQAMRNFEGRYPSLVDVKIFSTAFILQRETGGSLSQILEGLCDTIKKRFRFQRQIKTFSAEARISSIIIGLLPLLFVGITCIFNPQYISRLTDTPLGRVIVVAAFVFELIGFLVMKKMARIKV